MKFENMKSAIFHSLKKDIDAPFICICDSYEKHMMDIDWPACNHVTI